MYQKVVEIISEYLGNEVVITPKAEFVTDLGLNSFDVMSLVCDFEDAFEIEIPIEDIETLDTVQSVVDYLQDHTQTVAV